MNRVAWVWWPMHKERVIVVGAGMGGLASALTLAHQGHEVLVVEAHQDPGGKVHATQVEGRSIDSGPTVLTMRWVFDELFSSVAEDLEDHVRLTPLSVLARHFWSDGSRMDLCADPRQSEAEVERLAGAQEAQRFRLFCQRTRALYETLETPFMRRPVSQAPQFMADVGLSGLMLLSRLGPFRTLWQQLVRDFRDPRLQQLFGRYATYCGSSPWEAPATLTLIAQAEFGGVWSVDGGMQALARSVMTLAQKRGAAFRFESRCDRLEVSDQSVKAVILESGERLEADRVIFNGDPAALKLGLLGAQARGAIKNRFESSPGHRSLSALTWSMVAPRQTLDLDRHNVFFQSHYRSEFEDIFQHHRLPKAPTVYVCAQDRPTVCAEDRERIFCLVNAPANADLNPQVEDIDECEHHTFQQLSQMGLSLDPTQASRRSTPSDFHRRFPATGGALYGPPTHGWMSIFSRPGATTAIRGLYLAGGGVHPGPGVPMATLSGVRAAEAIMASRASIRPSPQVVTFGGMQTR